MRDARSAFTLIEILIVIAIIAVLTGVGFSYYTDSLQESREVVVRNNLKTVREAISMYFKDHMAYPKQLEVLTGPYLKENVTDLLIHPLGGDTVVYVEQSIDAANPEAFHAQTTDWFIYVFDGIDKKEIKNVKIKYQNNLMTW